MLIAVGCQPTTRASVSSTGVQGNGESENTAISDDGRFVAFSSSATNLVPGDTNGEVDTFVRDRQKGVTIRVSVSSSGTQSDGSSYPGAISGDGRLVAFTSHATNLVPGETAYGLYVHDIRTGVTTFEAPGGFNGDLDDVGRFLAYEKAGEVFCA